MSLSTFINRYVIEILSKAAINVDNNKPKSSALKLTGHDCPNVYLG